MLSAMEVINVNAGALAVGIIAVAATMRLFVCTPETSHVGTNRAHIVLITQLSSRKCTPNDIPRRVGPREEIE